MGIFEILLFLFLISFVVGIINGIVATAEERITYLTLIGGLIGIVGSLLVAFAWFVVWFVYWVGAKAEKSKLNKTLWRF